VYIIQAGAGGLPFRLVDWRLTPSERLIESNFPFRAFVAWVRIACGLQHRASTVICVVRSTTFNRTESRYQL